MDAMFSAEPPPPSRGPASTRSATSCTAPRGRYPASSPSWPGDLRVTFAEFDAAVNRAARALAARGLAKGDRLALLAHNCWQFAVLVFATAKLGVVLVPINFMLGADEIAFILGTPARRGMVAEDALARHGGEGDGRGRGAEAAIRGWIGPSAPPRPRAGRTSTAGGSDGPDDAPEVAVADDDPLRLMYTSRHRVAAQGRDAVVAGR